MQHFCFILGPNNLKKTFLLPYTTSQSFMLNYKNKIIEQINRIQFLCMSHLNQNMRIATKVAQKKLRNINMSDKDMLRLLLSLQLLIEPSNHGWTPTCVSITLFIFFLSHVFVSLLTIKCFYQSSCSNNQKILHLHANGRVELQLASQLVCA